MRRPLLSFVTGGGLLFFTLACSGLGAGVDGTALTVDGSPWAVDTCESGAVHGFSGVELSGMDGRRLRVQTLPDGQAQVYLFDVGAATGQDLGVCGTASFRPTGLTVNDIVALEGGGGLSCTGGPVEVVGEVQVTRCATPLF